MKINPARLLFPNHTIPKFNTDIKNNLKIAAITTRWLYLIPFWCQYKIYVNLSKNLFMGLRKVISCKKNTSYLREIFNGSEPEGKIRAITSLLKTNLKILKWVYDRKIFKIAMKWAFVGWILYPYSLFSNIKNTIYSNYEITNLYFLEKSKIKRKIIFLKALKNIIKLTTNIVEILLVFFNALHFFLFKLLLSTIRILISIIKRCDEEKYNNGSTFSLFLKA